MERGSNKHSPHVDEAMQREVATHTRGGPAGSRSGEWRDPEAVDDQQPDASWLPEGPHPGGAPPPLTGAELEARSRLGQLIPRSVLPADRAALLDAVDQNQAPAQLLAELERLPADREFATVYEIWEALGYRNER
ncbi:MAG TPA: DUF2795 domain-containing protein [Natronosporangium sp.]